LLDKVGGGRERKRGKGMSTLADLLKRGLSTTQIVKREKKKKRKLSSCPCFPRVGKGGKGRGRVKLRRWKRGNRPTRRKEGVKKRGVIAIMSVLI